MKIGCCFLGWKTWDPKGSGSDNLPAEQTLDGLLGGGQVSGPSTAPLANACKVPSDRCPVGAEIPPYPLLQYADLGDSEQPSDTLVACHCGCHTTTSLQAQSEVQASPPSS